MQFYLGTHQPQWLSVLEVPLFISYQRLKDRKTLPRAITSWALDSGGFSELSLRKTWTIPAADYVQSVRRYIDEIGMLDWVSIQDWMCEPHIIAGTKLTLEEHQHRTVASYLDLMDRAPEVPWAPVLQGWHLRDYFHCIDLYQRAGVDLWAMPVVGVGSICRRQATKEAAEIIRVLAGLGLNLHGFGFKLTGLAKVADVLASADSMAWSSTARFEPPLTGCSGHKNCANCKRYALQWYEKVSHTITTTITKAKQTSQQFRLAVAA